MSVRIIYPDKDATVYSEFPNKNTGLDEILEIASYTDLISRPQKARILLQFPQTEIDNLIEYALNNNYEYTSIFIRYKLIAKWSIFS